MSTETIAFCVVAACMMAVSIWGKLKLSGAKMPSLPKIGGGTSPAPAPGLISPPPSIGGADISDPYGTVRVIDELLDELQLSPAERHPLTDPILQFLLKRSEAAEVPTPGAPKA